MNPASQDIMEAVEMYEQRTYPTEARDYSPLEAATTRLKTALEAIEKTLGMLKEKLEPVMVPSQPTLQHDQAPRPDYPGGSPLVRDLSFCAEQVGDMIQMIDGISSRLEV